MVTSANLLQMTLNFFFTILKCKKKIKIKSAKEFYINLR